MTVISLRKPMTVTLDPTLKNRLARDIITRCKSLEFGVTPWLILNFEDLDSVRGAHRLSLDQLAEILFEVSYIWRDGAALSHSRLRELLEAVAMDSAHKRLRRPAA